MRELYTHLCLWMNFFSRRKLVAKSRRGAQVTKTFDRASRARQDQGPDATRDGEEDAN